MRNERAIAVAQDVLKYLPQYRLEKGVYLSGPNPVGNSNVITVDQKKVDLQDYTEVVTNTCFVCALGACLISKARLYDQIPLDSVFGDRRGSINRSTVGKLLEDVFSPQQLRMVESAFEMQLMSGLDWNMADYTPSAWTETEQAEVNAAVAYGRSYRGDPIERVRAVMDNIIKNDGEFKLEPVWETSDDDGVPFKNAYEEFSDDDNDED